MLTNYPSSNVQSSCDFILKEVRSSSLNYSVQETPFSLYLTIRKSLVKTKSKVKDPENIAVNLQFPHSLYYPEPFNDETNHEKCQAEHKSQRSQRQN